MCMIDFDGELSLVEKLPTKCAELGPPYSVSFSFSLPFFLFFVGGGWFLTSFRIYIFIGFLCLSTLVTNKWKFHVFATQYKLFFTACQRELLGGGKRRENS